MERLSRRILSLLLLMATAFPFQMLAQDTKVAVWGPSVKPGSENVEAIELSIINSRFRDAVSAMSGIEVISRTDVDNILSELQFQQNGMVSEDDKKLLGQMKGVDIIVSLMVAKGLGYINIESSFIDVEKANVIGRTQSVLANANDPSDLSIKSIELAKKLTGVTSSLYASNPYTSNSRSFDRIFTVNDVTFKMVFVKGGMFQMGNDYGEYKESPKHSVTVSDFYIGEFEVTQALWWEVMDTSDYQQLDKLKAVLYEYGNGADYPIYFISHVEAEGFCAKLNRLLHSQLPVGYMFSLPTEAEWEYAARGGNKTNTYTYAGSNYLSEVGWYTDNSNKTTHIVGSKKANELGLYDMSGNVDEWCSDWSAFYSGSSQIDPTGPHSGTIRVARGGSWFDYIANCRVTSRDGGDIPGNRLISTGFRLVLSHRQKVASKIFDTPTPTVMNEQPVTASFTKGNKDFIVNGLTFNMVYVEGGSMYLGCTMGSGNCEGDERPYHYVTLTDYFIGETEVTQALWKAVMGNDNNPSYWKGDLLPVEMVNWFDCQEFMSRLNNLLITQLPQGYHFALPSEAQWEYAAREGKNSYDNMYVYAGGINLSSVAWYDSNSKRHTHKVKQKSPNELGLYDMSGNVAEWCEDWYSSSFYSDNQNWKNPINADVGSSRVLRGGSWNDNESMCRVASRNSDGPGNSYNYGGGFRLALVHR